MVLASWKGTWIVSENGSSEIQRGSESPWTRPRAGWWEGADVGVAHARGKADTVWKEARYLCFERDAKKHESVLKASAACIIGKHSKPQKRGNDASKIDSSKRFSAFWVSFPSGVVFLLSRGASLRNESVCLPCRKRSPAEEGWQESDQK